MLWPKNLQFLIVKSNSIVIDRETLEQKVKKRRNKEPPTERPIQVGLLVMDWFYADRQNFNTFVVRLQRLPSSIYSSEFVAYLLNQYWKKTKMKIFWSQFLPFYFYVFTCVLYMYAAIDEEDDLAKEDKNQHNPIFKIFGVILLLMLINNIRVEIMQLRGTSAKVYFKQFFNYADMIQVIMTALLIVNILFEINILPREL